MSPGGAQYMLSELYLVSYYKDKETKWSLPRTKTLRISGKLTIEVICYTNSKRGQSLWNIHDVYLNAELSDTQNHMKINVMN